MLKVEFLLCVAGAVAQLASALLSPSNIPGVSEAILLIIVALWNLLIYVREARLTQREVITRVSTVVDDLRESQVFVDNTKIAENIPTGFMF